MKKTLSAIIGFIAFIILLSETDDLSVMALKSLICGAVLVFVLWINGAYQGSDESVER